MNKPWREVLTLDLLTRLKNMHENAPSGDELKVFGDLLSAFFDAADEADILLAENARLKEELSKAQPVRTYDCWWCRSCERSVNGFAVPYCPRCGGKVVVK